MALDEVAFALFSLVLPPEGPYFAVSIKNGVARRKPCDGFEQLWHLAKVAERQKRDAYFSTASFNSNGASDGENVRLKRALYFDADYGEGHKGPHYDDRDGALDAIVNLCSDLDLPFPLLVDTGGGFHGYWPLVECLTHEEWLLRAKGLKAYCSNKGYKFDPPATADAARILRVPGTTNFKLSNRPRPVELQEPRTQLALGPYPIALFDVLLQYKDATPSNVVSLKTRSQISSGLPSVPQNFKDLKGGASLTKQLADLAGHKPRSGVRVSQNCAQLAYMRDTRGVMSEPEWYASIGVLAFCEEDGDALSDEWSKGDDRYNPAEVEKKRTQWQALGAPATCAHFAGLSAGAAARCEGCPCKGEITSPAELGLEQPPAPPGARPKPVLIWKEKTEKGEPRASYHNTLVALNWHEVEGSYDVFHDRRLIKGPLTHLGTTLTDAMVRGIADLIQGTKSMFDPGVALVERALMTACEKHPFDPVRDYLDGLIWDGVARLDTWLPTYLGAEDTPINRAFGRCTLLGAVRRVRQPGAKWDFMLVLEGIQGMGKSPAIEILAKSDRNFSASPIKWDDPKQQAEVCRGKWIVEIAELSGLKKADVENVKSFLSRRIDEVRPAYGKFVVEAPRRCVFIGSTNSDKSSGYLADPTGAKRFWPCACGKVDLVALERDVDQLWAEAAHREAAGEDIYLSPSLYEAAREQQMLRREHLPLADRLDVIVGTAIRTLDGWIERIASDDVMTFHLGLPASQQTSAMGRQAAAAMRLNGWERTDFRMDRGGQSKVIKGYKRPACERAIEAAEKGARS